jgi:hypothetical protein
VDHLSVLRLRWPENPRLVREGDSLDLSLQLENGGSETVEFTDGFLSLFGRLLDADGREVTDGYPLRRKLPRIIYRLEPGDSKTVSVGITLSPDRQRFLAVGRYTVTIPLGDQRDAFTNSVLYSARAAPPPPLTVEVRPH